MSDIIKITTTSFTAGSGKFDSTKRYLRQALTGTGTPMVQGKSADASGSPNYYMYRYSVNGYVKQATYAYRGNLGDITVTANPFVGADVLVKKT